MFGKVRDLMVGYLLEPPDISRFLRARAHDRARPAHRSVVRRGRRGIGSGGHDDAVLRRPHLAGDISACAGLAISPDAEGPARTIDPYPSLRLGRRGAGDHGRR